jgi:hypothetical protein
LAWADSRVTDSVQIHPAPSSYQSRGEPAGITGREPSQEGLETLPGFHVNDRLKRLDDRNIRLEFKKPWSDGEGRGEVVWGGAGWAGPNPVGARRRLTLNRSPSSRVYRPKRYPRVRSESVVPL